MVAPVQSLTVRRRDLRRLADLERLVNVRLIDLAQNEIARMEGLDALANLEKLNMEENRVAQIETPRSAREPARATWRATGCAAWRTCPTSCV